MPTARPCWAIRRPGYSGSDPPPATAPPAALAELAPDELLGEGSLLDITGCDAAWSFLAALCVKIRARDRAPGIDAGPTGWALNMPPRRRFIESAAMGHVPRSASGAVRLDRGISSRGDRP